VLFGVFLIHESLNPSAGLFQPMECYVLEFFIFYFFGDELIHRDLSYIVSLGFSLYGQPFSSNDNNGQELEVPLLTTTSLCNAPKRGGNSFYFQWYS